VVGKRGFEPLSFSLSGSCSNLLSCLPADGGGPDPQRSRARPGSSQGLPPGSFTIHARKTEDPTPCGCPLTRFRIGDRLHSGFIFQKRRTEYSKLTHKEPLAFQAVTAPWRLRPPWRRAENSNPTPKRALVSSEAQALPGSPSVPHPRFELGTSSF
jgi:hypothetical protein